MEGRRLHDVQVEHGSQGSARTTRHGERGAWGHVGGGAESERASHSRAGARHRNCGFYTGAWNEWPPPYSRGVSTTGLTAVNEGERGASGGGTDYSGADDMGRECFHSGGQRAIEASNAGVQQSSMYQPPSILQLKLGTRRKSNKSSKRMSTIRWMARCGERV